jgi:nucleoside-diphosphate-sugar epimerase
LKKESKVRVAVAGAGGFIGGHLVSKLANEGFDVVACDIKPIDQWFQLPVRESVKVLDLREKSNCYEFLEGVDICFNLACDMGGMGFIENNKAKCMESVLINTHLLLAARFHKIDKFFFSSSACVYASNHQSTPSTNALKETDAYPADPEDGYGWEKLFSERFCRNFFEDYGIKTYVARYHNVYGPFGTFEGGREKVPAAACRKMIEYKLGQIDEIEIWGDGNQVRSFTYINDCLTGTMKLLDTDFHFPLNIGSSEAVTIRALYDQVAIVAGLDPKQVKYKYVLSAPQGVRGRSSDNTLCNEVLNWEPNTRLDIGLRSTFDWIQNQITL